MQTVAFANTELSLNEGQSGTTVFAFGLVRSSAEGKITINYEVRPAGDTPGNALDAAGLSNGRLVMSSGVSSTTASIGVTGDTIAEANETLQIVLTSATVDGVPVQIVTPTATATILNDDSGTPGNYIQGTDGTDTVVGTDGYDILSGLKGDDIIFSGAGNDEATGDFGNDIIFGESGDDQLYGGAGDDHLYGNWGDDALGGRDGNDYIVGSFGNDRLFGKAGSDSLYGGGDQDTLYGGNDADILNGNDGHDEMGGGSGNDSIHAGDGDDIVYGGLGDDTINGFDGADTLYGGAGDDLVYLGARDGRRDVYGTVTDNGKDTIWRFEDGIDVLDLSGSDFTSFADIRGQISMFGSGNTRIDLGDGGSLIIAEVTPDKFDASDFLF